MTNSPTSLLDFIRRRIGVGELTGYPLHNSLQNAKMQVDSLYQKLGPKYLKVLSL